MGISWCAEIVDQIDSHWRFQLRPRLQGLSDDEYFWQPAPDSRDLGGPQDGEPVTTIAWRLGHLIVGLAETNGIHFGGPAVQLESFGHAGTAEEALRQFDDTYGQWIEGVRGLGAAGLIRPQGPTSPPEFADAPMARLILYTSVEIIHHGAEICLLRDLYRQRRSQLPVE